MAQVKLENVNKIFGEHVALEHINIEIRDGEFFTMLGPSGCGKTTALRLVAGLEAPDTGRIWLAGKDVTEVPPAKRRVAMVFQNYALYPHMNIFENISYPLRIRKMSKPDIEARVEAVAEKLYLKSLLERMPSQVSGGQQQRVAVARAMVQDPVIYLFDEPLSNLDAKLRTEARRFLKRIQKETEITAVYVTHDQTEAMAMSDRIAVLRDGCLMQLASPKEIYEKPKNVFVAGFVGNPPMNLIEGKVRREGNTTIFSAGTLSIPLDIKPELKITENITLGVRPENISLKPADKGVEIEALIEDVEELGSETVVSLAKGEINLLARLVGTEPPTPGQRVSAFLDNENFHLFNDKGVRI